MADKRMFSKTIIDSDAFLDMPQTTQLLYFHLSMRADDDGFINNPKSIMRYVKCSEDDIKILITKKFIIPFESGIVVIKHWKIHNYIAKDRYTETKYKDEKALLNFDENNAYTTNSTSYTECIQPVYELSTQVRLGKDRLGKDSIGKDRKDIVAYVPDELLNLTILKFIEMRKKIKAPITDYGIELVIKKLDKMASDNDTKIQILNQSIESSWKGIFELKENKKSSTDQYAKDLEEWANDRK